MCRKLQISALLFSVSALNIWLDFIQRITTMNLFTCKPLPLTIKSTFPLERTNSTITAPYLNDFEICTAVQQNSQTNGAQLLVCVVTISALLS